MKIVYEGILIGEVVTNQSMTTDQALNLLDFNEETFCSMYNLDGIDYNEMKVTY